MTRLGETIRVTEQLASSTAAALLRAASLALAGDGRSGLESLPPALLARLQRDAAEARALYNTLAEAKGLSGALGAIAVLARGGSDRILAIAALVDLLADEAERRGGTRTGRGAYKRQQVKAALLYAVRRGGYTIPLVPSFLEPVIFSIGADLLIDFTVAHINAQQLWQPGLTRTPIGLWSRVMAPLLLAIRTVFLRASELFAGLAWSLILAANHLSPAARAAVDRAVASDATAIAALVSLRAFLEANPRFVTGAAALLGIATRQAEALTDLSGPEKQAYVRELVMIVLEQQGIVGQSPLLDRIIETVVTIGIDATVALFNRRGLFS